MANQGTVERSRLFRLVTIFTSGFGAASLSLWAVMLNRLGDGSSAEFSVLSGVVAGLAALAGAGCAHAYFAGADEATKVYEEALATDTTTGLLSRRGLEQKILSIAKSGRSKATAFDRWMLVSVEVDAFRDINDAHGMEIGDKVLRKVGQRIGRMVGKLGPVARIAGSEFALAIDVSWDARELHTVMAALIDEVAKPVSVGTATIPIFCTAGLVELSPDQLVMTKLLYKAALARTTAKATGLGTWAIYHPEMTQSDTYRKWIQAELTHAIQGREFDLVYQPQVNAITRKTVGYEALIRWNHPEKGVIPPNEFIAVAERCGLINQIGGWVLRQACADTRHFADDIKVAVNVSPKQMDNPEFVDTLASIMQENGTDPQRIEIEITENILICDHAVVRRQFNRIRELGCSIAIDDFGTGYSNLTSLSELPFSKLKLDRSFVTRIEEHGNGGALVSTIVNLARALEVDILAEGVETEGQIVMLKAAGCTLMQGYYYGKPVKLDRSGTDLKSIDLKSIAA